MKLDVGENVFWVVAIGGFFLTLIFLTTMKGSDEADQVEGLEKQVVELKEKVEDLETRKGDLGGDCNHDACTKVAELHHQDDRRFYCVSCARKIQEAEMMGENWRRLFRRLGQRTEGWEEMLK
jgi:hypothetical protein